MFRGKMALPAAARLEEDLTFMKARYGLNAIQFYDHNFFDREVDMAVPLLQVLAKLELPWWCFASAPTPSSIYLRPPLGAGPPESVAHGLYRRRIAQRLVAP